MLFYTMLLILNRNKGELNDNVYLINKSPLVARLLSVSRMVCKV